MAWMELMANNTPMATQEEGSNVIPKWSGRGSWNMDADATEEKFTIPNASAAIYPTTIPINMEESFQIPLP